MQRSLPVLLLALVALLLGFMYWGGVPTGGPGGGATQGLTPMAPLAGDPGSDGGPLEQEGPAAPDAGLDREEISTESLGGGDAAAEGTRLTVRAVWPDQGTTAGSPAVGIRVGLWGADPVIGYRLLADGITDDAGEAVFADLAEARYSVRSHRGDRQGFDVAGAEQVVAFTLEPGVAVGGVVLDEVDEPVAGASVWLQTRESRWMGGSVVAESGPDGRFQLEQVRPVVSLGAFAPLCTRGPLVDLETLDTDTVPVEVTLRVRRDGGDLVGRVIDGQGQPVADALVGFDQQRDSNGYVAGREVEVWSVPNTKTDGDGRYALSGLKSGEAELSVFHPEHGYVRREVEVLAGRSVTCDVRIATPGTLRGVVRDGAGEPISGAVIRVYDREPSTPFLQGGQIDFDRPFGYLRAVSAVDGGYELANVTAGTIHAFAQFGDNGALAEIVPWDQVELEMPPAGELIWDPVISEGETLQGVVQFRDGHPMGFHFVTLTDERDGRQSPVNTDKEGRFKFIKLPPSTFSLSVQYWDAPMGAPELKRSGLVPGQRGIVLVAPFDKPVKGEPGEVTGQIDDVGQRVTNWKTARVCLMPDRRWFLDDGVIQDGRFRFVGVKPCRFRLALMQGEAELATSDWFQLQPGQALDTGTLRTESAGSLRLRILRGEGLEAVEWTSYLRRTDAPRSTQVPLGPADEVVVANLTPGEYTLTGRPVGALPIEATTTVVAGQVVDVDVRLAPGCRVLTRAWFHSHPSRGDAAPALCVYRVFDTDGQLLQELERRTERRPTTPFQVSIHLPAGRYRVEVTSDGELSHRGEWQVERGTARMEVELKPVGR